MHGIENALHIDIIQIKIERLLFKQVSFICVTIDRFLMLIFSAFYLPPGWFRIRFERWELVQVIWVGMDKGNSEQSLRGNCVLQS